MSENLDLVRSIWAAWERGDFSSAEWAHRDIEFVFAYGVEPTTAKGLTEMANLWRRALSAYQGLRAEADDYRELDDERVVALHSFSGRGKTSGLDVARTSTQGASVFHIRGGKVVRLVLYFDRDRGLADLGLKE
jgi:ketosteroid isomerase-like protein